MVAAPSPAELERYLHAHIPLSRAMQVSVLELSGEQALLAAPLAPNVNHLGTVFGGSACALATLAAWSLLHYRLHECVADVSVVLRRNSMSFERPVAGSFRACAVLAPPAPWPRFLRTLERHGKARIAVLARLTCEQGEAGAFSGEYVALARTGARS